MKQLFLEYFFFPTDLNVFVMLVISAIFAN